MHCINAPHFWVVTKLLMQLPDLVFQLIFVFLQSFWKICWDSVWCKWEDIRSRYKDLSSRKITCVSNIWSRKKLPLLLHAMFCTTRSKNMFSITAFLKSCKNTTEFVCYSDSLVADSVILLHIVKLSENCNNKVKLIEERYKGDAFMASTYILRSWDAILLLLSMFRFMGKIKGVHGI